MSPPSLFAPFVDILLLVKLYHYVRYTVKQELKKEEKQEKYIREKNDVEKVRYGENAAPRYGAVYETRGNVINLRNARLNVIEI